MNTIEGYLLQFSITALISLALVLYFRPHLRLILVDLCGTSERAQFWVVFASIILVSLPLILGLGYNPQKSESLDLIFSVAHQVRNNLIGFLFALIGIGFGVSFFALVAPRPAVK
jgi:uncharacterized membrane protein YhaH (DUF805 family)